MNAINLIAPVYISDDNVSMPSEGDVIAYSGIAAMQLQAKDCQQPPGTRREARHRFSLPVFRRK